MAPPRAETVTCRSSLGDREIVTDDQMNLFCSMIQFHPGEGRENYDTRRVYIHRTNSLSKKLNFPLSRPNAVVRKALLPKQSDYTHLCDMHKGLNADFVHQWFTLIALEVGLRMNSLIAAGREYIGEMLWDSPLMHLRQFHKLWLSPEQVRETFGKSLDQSKITGLSGLSLHHQEDGCEACILSRIGSHLPTVLALRCVAHSRMGSVGFSRHLRRMRLERILSGWLLAWQNNDAVPKGAFANALRQNSEMASSLHDKRTQLRKQRKRDNRSNKSTNGNNSSSTMTTQDSGELEDDDVLGTIHDAENDIIDTYAALRSTCYLPTTITYSSVLYDGQSRASARQSVYTTIGFEDLSISDAGSPRHTPLFPRETYNESVYSVDTIRNNARVLATSSVYSSKTSADAKRIPLDSPSASQLYTLDEEVESSGRYEISPTRQYYQQQALQKLQQEDQLPRARYSPKLQIQGAGKRAQNDAVPRTFKLSHACHEDQLSKGKKQRMESDMTTFSKILRLHEEPRSHSHKSNHRR